GKALETETRRADYAEQDKQQAHHQREDVPADGKFRQRHDASPPATASADRTFTLAPSDTSAAPSTMTVVPAARPSSISMKPSRATPVLTLRSRAVPFSISYTTPPAGRSTTACSGTVTAPLRTPSVTSPRTLPV